MEALKEILNLLIKNPDLIKNIVKNNLVGFDKRGFQIWMTFLLTFISRGVAKGMIFMKKKGSGTCYYGQLTSCFEHIGDMILRGEFVQNEMEDFMEGNQSEDRIHVRYSPSSIF